MQLNNTKMFNALIVTALTLAMLLGNVYFSLATSDPIRIVVLPFYNEKGVDTKDGGLATNHYRSMISVINSHLVRHDFEVFNPFASDSAAMEYNRVQETARKDSSLASLEMCKKYKTDVAYIVWLDIKARKTADGYCKAESHFRGEGYDSAGHDLGVGIAKTIRETRRGCEDAIAEVEKQVGDYVGERLTTWNNEEKPSLPSNSSPVAVDKHSEKDGGILADNSKKYKNIITVRLDGATDYAIVEIFGKVVNTARGVIAAKLYSSVITPDNAQASYVHWRVTTQDTDIFRLQSNILTMLNDILDSGGSTTIKGVPYRYTPAEIDLLKGIRPATASSKELQFVLDRDLARERDLSGKHAPHKNQFVN
jgi:hypothetical protein